MTLQADNDGIINGVMHIPDGVIPAGTKLVEFFGGANPSPSYATSSFVARGTISIAESQLVRRRVYNVNTKITTTTITYVDPIAQSFALTETCQLSFVDVWFEGAKGTTDVTLVVREMVNGFPGPRAFAESIKKPSEISISGPTRFTFDPTEFEADRLYCFVLMCNDAVWRVRIAKLGDVDGPTQQRIAGQPYMVGTLFSSSNNTSWTIHQDSDMKFRLGGPTYATLTRIVPLPDQTITDADYLAIMAAVERPSIECDVVFRVTLPTGEILDMYEGVFELLPSRQTGTLQIDAIVTGTANLTPVLYPDMQVLTGTSDTESLYVTRAINIQASPNNYDTKVTVLFDYKAPGSATITVEIYDAEAEVWLEVPIDADAWILPLANGWTEQVLALPDLDTAVRASQLRITLTGDAWNRPEIRRLRVTCNDNPP
jgi:hypothetical protein